MQSGALAHHYNTRMPVAGRRLKTRHFHCSFVVLCILYALCIVFRYSPSTNHFPLTVLFIPCLWTACSSLVFVAVTYLRGDASCLPCDTRTMGFMAEGACYGAAFHPWS
jgi:hypothetical protein